MRDEHGRRNIISERLKSARLAADPPLAMTALSRRLLLDYDVDISANALAKIENGTRYANDYEVVALIQALGVSCEWLGLTRFCTGEVKRL